MPVGPCPPAGARAGVRARAWGGVAVVGRNSGDWGNGGAVGPSPGVSPPVRCGPRAGPRRGGKGAGPGDAGRGGKRTRWL